MMRFSDFLFLALSLQIAICRPSEEPTRFSLIDSGKSIEKVEDPKQNSTPTIQQGLELLGRISDKIRFGRGRLVNSIILARNIYKEGGEDWLDQIAEVMKIGRARFNNSATLVKNNLINQEQNVASESQNTLTSVLPPNNILPQKKSFEKTSFTNLPSSGTRETVILESENNQGIFERPKLNPVAGILENLLRPTPIVDGIKESQKYGNSGDKFIGIGRVLVNGFEGFSNFLNVIVDLPVKAAKQTSRGITEALNQFGARLIGLQ